VGPRAGLSFLVRCTCEINVNASINHKVKYRS